MQVDGVRLLLASTLFETGRRVVVVNEVAINKTLASAMIGHGSSIGVRVSRRQGGKARHVE